MKEGWVATNLGSVVSFENGDRGKNYPSRSKFVDEGIAFVNAGHLENGKVQIDQMNYITESTFEKLSRGKFKRGDLLFCLRGSLGKFAIIENGLRGAIASSLVIVRASDRITNQYLSYYQYHQNAKPP